MQTDVDLNLLANHKGKLSNALKLISKMKSYEIKQKNRQDALLDSQKDAIFQLNTVTMGKKGSKKSRGGILAPSKTGAAPLLFRKQPQQSPVKRRKSEIDQQATSMVFKVEYEQMEPADKLDYLKVQIQDSEVALREKTDRALQSQRAFDAIMENQRFFAVCQDKFANLAKKRREEIALRSVKEVNDLIS